MMMRYRGGGVGHQSTQESCPPDHEDMVSTDESHGPSTDVVASAGTPRDFTEEELEALALVPVADADVPIDEVEALSDDEQSSHGSQSDQDHDEGDNLNHLGVEDGEESFVDLLAQEGYDQL